MKNKVIALFQQGFRYREISKQLGISNSEVYKYCKEYLQQKNSENDSHNDLELIVIEEDQTPPLNTDENQKEPEVNLSLSYLPPNHTDKQPEDNNGNSGDLSGWNHNLFETHTSSEVNNSESGNIIKSAFDLNKPDMQIERKVYTPDKIITTQTKFNWGKIFLWSAAIYLGYNILRGRDKD